MNHKKFVQQCFQRLIFLIGLFLSSQLLASDTGHKIERNDPDKMLRQATAVLLDIAKEAKSDVDQDKQRYYREGEVVLNQIIDKSYFARGVMATYASARLYKSLKSDAEKEAFKNRVKQFSDTMQIVLIEKYADALLLFNGERIDFDGVVLNSDDGSKVSIKQIIYDKDDKSYAVQYSMHKDKNSQWLIYNVIVEGINLGFIYRSQFAEAVEKNKGDVDYVVKHWSSILKNEKSSND